MAWRVMCLLGTLGAVSASPAAHGQEADAGVEPIGSPAPLSGPDAPPPSVVPPAAGATLPVYAPPQDSPAQVQAAQELYKQGFALMVQHRWGEAATAFDRLVQLYPDSPEAPIASEMARLARDSAQPPHLKLRQPELGESEIDRGGRVEFLITTSVFGLWTGAALGIAANWGGAGSVVSSALAGVAGLSLGIWATSNHSISQGGASLMSTGLLFGTLDGGLLDILLAPSDTPTQILLVWFGSAVGLATAAVVQAWLPISPGQASLIAGGGFLAGALTGVAFGLDSGNSPQGDAVAGAFMLTTFVGLAGGAVASHWFHPTRGRVVLSELAGILGGGLAGGAVALAIPGGGGGSGNAVPVSVGIGLGMLAGAGAVLVLTDDMNEGLGDLALNLPGGIQLQAPSPMAWPSQSGGPPILSLSLLQGAF